ncbi:PadR family transcriptional regulator [Paenibacillus koleovorans]|uniref:PadR family transcriptional regulator n=1 Tax=Paenibacillus koleovorans TaxID=121608 RepID=UPI000FD9F4AE|nr:PadR family transcriptional regulator [Paenibacillus koleovorans]
MGNEPDILNNMLQELRRGTLVLSVLSQLAKAQYGYSLIQSLEEKGISIEANTLYPLLRRLEAQGLLESKWDTEETRPRKYYLLSPLGEDIYRRLCAEWKSMAQSVDRLIEG